MSDTLTTSILSTEQETSILTAFERQKKHHWTVARCNAAERITKLRRLHDAVLQYRNEIKEALLLDLGKCSTEVDVSEVGVVNSEIRHAIRHLRSWMAPLRVGTPLFLVGTSSRILYQPKGVCLIISPWNYPINLTLAPLVSAIAAGNCAILKPSEYTPNCATLLKKIVATCFPPEEVSVIEGDASVAQRLLSLPFNHIFFTGSPAVGQMVMRAAATHLASVTLELGGKSPVVVDESANIDHAAAKIIWLKCMNAGQICIAPDYVLVHESVHDQLVQSMAEKIKEFYGDRADTRRKSADYCKIVHERHVTRISTLLEDAVSRGANVVIGGSVVPAERFIEPTILTQIPESAAIWDEEIFGPIMPVRPYKSLVEAIDYINSKPRPLALYIFSSSKSAVENIHAETRAGGGSVNDCGIHFYHPSLPFGGVNNSGSGSCHGKAGFLDFSNQRGITYQNRIFPTTNMFLPPYGKSRAVKWLLECVVKWF
jgi:aldehyde dehydrogenase (NAD+)